MIWILVLLMIVPEGFDYGLLASSPGAPTAGGILSRLLWLGLLGFGLVVICWRASAAWLLIRTFNPFLLAFIGLAVASLAWSADPSVTARRLIRGVTILVDSLAFALLGWHSRRFQSVLRPLCTAVLAGSIVFGLAWPTLAIHQESSGVLEGAWHGLANHKNGLGNIACIGLLLCLHAFLSRETPLWKTVIGVCIAAICLILSRSSTSLMATVFSLIFLTMLLRSPVGLRPYMPYLVGLFVAVLLVYSLAMLNVMPGMGVFLKPIGMLTGKDLTFTGRTDIWDIMQEHIRLQPYLGSGYGAYWTGADEATASYEHVRRLQFYPGSAHNGYLEILNELGAIGLLVLFGYLIVFVSQALTLLKVDRVQASIYLALFLQQAITNLAESRWLSPLSVDFVIMTLATAGLARALIDHRLNRGSQNAWPRAGTVPAR